MENEEVVYGYVKSIADEQQGKNETISRADVAFILQDKYKVKCADGVELSRDIYRAYEKMGKPESIRRMIVTNSGEKSVVEEYELNSRLNQGETENAISLVEKNLNDAQELIDEAKQRITDVLKIELAQDAAALSKWFQGTGGIEQIKTKSAALMDNYGKMVACYNAAETGVKNDVHDFVVLRSDVNSRFVKYANALVDIFGDSVKVVDPELFNFDNIQYLDTTAMQQHTQLAYDKLDQNCTLLLGEVASHYSETLNQVPMWLKVGQNVGKNVGQRSGLYGSLAVGAVSFLNHWLSAQEKTTRMQNEYVNFEKSVKRDRQQMDGDMMRLMTVHKVMNDLYIPRAATFARKSDEVMSDDLKELIQSLYSGEVAPLVKERDGLLERIKKLEQSVNDHSENIAMFDSQIADIKGMLDAQKDNYQKASERKPAEPGMLKRFLTFGVAQKNYGRKLLEWDEQDGALVNAYEDALMDLEEGKEDLNTHTEQLAKDKQEYETCKARLAELNRLIKEKIRATPEQKSAALKHLKNMVTLLHAGKKIMESRLDDQLLQVVVPKELSDIASLPSEIESNLRGFVDDICSEIKKEGGNVSQSIMHEFGLSQTAEKEELSGHMNVAVDKAADLIKNWSYMQTEQMKSQLTDAVYRQEMERMKREFQETMSALNQESDALVEVMKRANTAADKEDLRKALIELAGVDASQLSEADFDAILAGKKQIEI